MYRLTYRHFFYLLSVVISLTMIAAPASAHMNGDHKLGIVDGLLHLFTQPAHALILLLALAVLYLGGRIRKWRRQ